MGSDWRSSLSTLDRFTIIQNLQVSLPEDQQSHAIAIEQDAYETSNTRDEYDAALNPGILAHGPRAADQRHDGGDGSCQDQEAAGGSSSSSSSITIGAYRSCVLVATGVTSQVYRSGEHALKVIVARRNLEPHNPQREASILTKLGSKQQQQHDSEQVIRLIETFRDCEQQFVLVFPYLPLTLESLLSGRSTRPPTTQQLVPIFTDILRALATIHARGIIHRDIKPSAILLQSPSGPARLSDFGTAWDADLSVGNEPLGDKILDIGTGAYRSPEVLFANKAYGSPVDMWALGVVLAEAITSPSKPPFESRPAYEDGSQLGLILSIFKTMGTPNEETWPEARHFKVSPFELWNVFPPRSWAQVLPDANALFRDLVARLLCFESGSRATAVEALNHPCLENPGLRRLH